MKTPKLLLALLCLLVVSPSSSNLVAQSAPAPPVLNPTQAYSTFHPYEVIRFSWSPVAGAATYVLQASTDPSFPPTNTIKFDNIPSPAFSFAIGNPEGNYSARVIAIDASGVSSAPSNVITFSVFFNNPIGPAPTLASPASGATLTLPITLTWNHVPNPQPSGYELQIARDSGFTSIEDDSPQLNGPSRVVLSLTSGTKFWRVRSFQGSASPSTSAATAWSASRSFVVPAGPPRPVSITVTKDPMFPGESAWAQVQLHECRRLVGRDREHRQLESIAAAGARNAQHAGQYGVGAVHGHLLAAGHRCHARHALRDDQLGHRVAGRLGAAGVPEGAADVARGPRGRRLDDRVDRPQWRGAVRRCGGHADQRQPGGGSTGDGDRPGGILLGIGVGPDESCFGRHHRDPVRYL